MDGELPHTDSSKELVNLINLHRSCFDYVCVWVNVCRMIVSLVAFCCYYGYCNILWYILLCIIYDIYDLIIIFPAFIQWMFDLIIWHILVDVKMLIFQYFWLFSFNNLFKMQITKYAFFEVVGFCISILVVVTTCCILDLMQVRCIKLYDK